MTAAATPVESDEHIRTILRNAKTIALVGASPKPWRDSNGIMKVLLGAGYAVTPVNPGYSDVLGRSCVPDLRAVAGPIDIVNVFRRPSALPLLVEEAIGVGATTLWMQPGTVHEEAAARASEAGLLVVAGRCIAVELRRLL